LKQPSRRSSTQAEAPEDTVHVPEFNLSTKFIALQRMYKIVTVFVYNS